MIVDLIVVARAGATAVDWKPPGVRAVYPVDASDEGYGAACLRAIGEMQSSLRPPEVIVFVDAEPSLQPRDLEAVLAPILSREADLALGSRTTGPRAHEIGCARKLAIAALLKVVQIAFRQRYTDIGPVRAIRTPALVALGLRERGEAFRLEMQIRAARAHLRIVEVPVASGLGTRAPLGAAAIATVRTLVSIARLAPAR